MLTISRPRADRLDITLSGSLDSDQMRTGLDQLTKEAASITHGKMLYTISDFEMPTLGAMAVEFYKMPQMLGLIGKFDKCAVISDTAWIRKAAEIEGMVFRTLAIKSFSAAEIKAAEIWLDTDVSADGFDGMVNIVEETKNPARNMPLGIFITLAIATLLYFLVASVAVLVLPLDELARSTAPISLLFERLTGISPLAITLIAIGATLNGVVIQTILASRILYGMANTGRLPKALATLNSRTRTPVLATVIVAAGTLIFALFFPIRLLAERTSQVVLVVFVLINLSLVRIKWRGDPAPEYTFTVPAVVPVIGLLTCFIMLVGPFLIAS